MQDFPTKSEAKGSRQKRRDRNPWARSLENKQYRQRVRNGKKSKRRQRIEEIDPELDYPMGDDPNSRDL